MKKGYLYLVIANDDRKNPDTGKYHFYEIGSVVECMDDVASEEGGRRFEGERVFHQTLQPHHVFEIGEI